MRFRICLVLVMLLGLHAEAQTRKTAPSATSDDSCGAIGCVGTGVRTAPVVPGEAAPVVIRSAMPPLSQGGKVQDMAPAPLLPAAPTIFEQFVHDSLGHSLPEFGRSLFAASRVDFVAPPNIAPPADYVLGTGDEVIIRAWGKIDIDARAVVDPSGQIFVPRLGTLTVAGMRVDELPGFIRGAISQQFKGFNLTVTLGQLRSIQVFVLGEAQAPGVHTISSLSTLVNALFLSGGPSPQGTLRDIQLKRGGQIISHFDVYRLLLNGDKSSDVHLLSGDIIFIPLIGSQVAVDGQVLRPGIFEIKDGETIASLLKQAGGLSVVAGTSRAALEHVVGHARRSVEDIPLDDASLRFPLTNGDILRVFPISPKIDDAVTLRGTIASPGRYAWKPGMHVSDLIPNRQFLLTRAYFNGQNALDVPGSVHAFGRGGRQNDAPGVDTHNTEINWNYAVIQRLDPQALTVHLVPFRLADAIDQPHSTEDKELEPGDVVVVYSRKEVALPAELQARFVHIDGEVNAPGIYRLEDNETLQDLVRRAGGLAPHAYLYAAQLTRESVREVQDAELHAMLERESVEALSPINLPSSLTGGAGAATGELDIRRAYIAELSKVHATGRVVLQTKPGANTNDDVPRYLLEDGDHFYVPMATDVVFVLGSVYNQGAIRYLDGGIMQRYLDAAGGATREGDTKREFILRADGTLISRQRVSGLTKLAIYPGDKVIVPPRLKSGSKLSNIITVTQLVSAAALSAVAIEAVR